MHRGSPGSYLDYLEPSPLIQKTQQQHVTNPPDSQRNFLVVDAKTETSAIESAFRNFTHERRDIGVLLINQHVWLFSPFIPRGLEILWGGDIYTDELNR